VVSALAPIPNVSFVALRVKTGKVAHHQRLTWVHVPSHGTCTCSRHMKKQKNKINMQPTSMITLSCTCWTALMQAGLEEYGLEHEYCSMLQTHEMNHAA